MDRYEDRFKATGTAWSIVVFAASRDEAERAFAAAKARVEEFEKTYSRFRSDSTVAKIAASAGEYRLPDDARGLFEIYRRLYEATSGRVTPTIGQVLVDAGYDAAYSLSPKETISPARPWDEAISYEYPMLVAKEPVQLDFGAVGKGYAIDLAAAALRESGIASYAVDAGGDILHASADGAKIRVGLEDPDDSSLAIGVALVGDGAIAGSSGNRRRWAGYTHIIDALSASSPTRMKAVWATAGSAAMADAMTTALFFADPVSLQAEFRFEYLILGDDRSAVASDGFPGEIFT